MTPLGEKLLRGAIRTARAGRSSEAIALVEMLAAILVAEDLEPEPGPQRSGSTSAERMRRKRERDGTVGPSSVTPRDGPRDGPDVENVTSRDASLGGGKGGVSLQGDSVDTREETNPARESASHVTPSRDVTRKVDGTWLVDAWLEGMRQATGRPSWQRRSVALGALSNLAALLEAEAPADGDATAWARELAVEYCAKNAGGQLNVFACIAWVQSGRPERQSGTRLATVPARDADPEAAQRAARARNEAADRKVAEEVAKARAAAPKAPVEAARAADDDQARRARAASFRPPAPLADLAGRPVVKRPLSQAELDAERQRQLAALEELQRKEGVG